MGSEKLSGTKSKVAGQFHEAGWSLVNFTRNTFCISCHCHMGKDRFFPVSVPPGPVLEANPERHLTHWHRHPSRAVLRPGVASEIGGKDGEVGRGAWKGRHRNPAGLAVSNPGRFWARGWLLTFPPPRSAVYHNDSEPRRSVLEA